MSQYRYYGSGAQRSADMKAIYRRVKASAPAKFKSKLVDEQRYDDKAEAVRVVQVHAKPDAVPMSPRERHKHAVRPWGESPAGSR